MTDTSTGTRSTTRTRDTRRKDTKRRDITIRIGTKRKTEKIGMKRMTRSTRGTRSTKRINIRRKINTKMKSTKRTGIKRKSIEKRRRADIKNRSTETRIGTGRRRKIDEDRNSGEFSFCLLYFSSSISSNLFIPYCIDVYKNHSVNIFNEFIAVFFVTY